MTLIELIKTSLRTSTTDNNYTGQIIVLFETAKSILASMGVHDTWLEFDSDIEVAAIDFLIATYVSCYVCWMYPNDSINRDEWKTLVELHAALIHMLDKYTEEKPL